MPSGSVGAPRSDALQANAARTARSVVVPSRYEPLLDAVQAHVGVHSAVRSTLTEYFHEYRDTKVVVAGLGAMQLHHWTHLSTAPTRTEVFELVSDLSIALLREGLSPDQFSALLRTTLTWCQSVLGGEHAVEFDRSAAQLLRALGELLESNLAPFLERDTVVRDVLHTAEPDSSAAVAASELFRRLLLRGYERLTDRLDLPAWALSDEVELTDRLDVAHRFAGIGASALRQHRDEVRATKDLRRPVVMTYSQLLDQALAALASCNHVEDRFTACLFLLKDDTLGHRQQHALRELLTVVKELVPPGSGSDVAAVLTRLTRFFRDRGDEFILMRLACYEAIGRVIGETDNENAADHLLNDILSWRFQYPEIAGATDDWQTVANPNHLPTIRCWLAIIESNPALFERLAAALDVQLRLGGVHICDTDLFQRDVTRFLNSDLRDIYFVATQLLRVFPVYFADVGAEGELRSVSTQLSEVSLGRDTLLHFLRKQVHAESSNRLVAFSVEVLRYWLTLSTEGLAPYVSANVLAAVDGERSLALGPHDLLERLRPELGAPNDRAFLDRVLQLDHDWLFRWSLDHTAVHADAVRVTRLVRTHQLLLRKYSLTSETIAADVRRFEQLRREPSEAFGRAYAQWSAASDNCSRDDLMDAALDVLGELREIILDPAPGIADEQLYYKRHIAAGIPSIYGRYREPKFEAAGLSLRVESLVRRLLEDVVNEGVEPCLTRDSLRRIAVMLGRFERALSIAGIASGTFSDCLRMLEASFEIHSFSFHQYQNVFAMLARSVSELSDRSVRSHHQILRRTLAMHPHLYQQRGLTPDGLAEAVLRELLVSSLGIQELDRYVGELLRKTTELNNVLEPSDLTRMMNYDSQRLVWPLHGGAEGGGDLLTLGAKGHGLVAMAEAGHHVPEGFVLSTELFRARSLLDFQPMSALVERQVREALTQLERACGRRLADPDRPLFLSVRSGSAISMPGLMTTFVNVGLNAAIAEQLAARPGFAWAAWDSYRRSLQSWAMFEGVARDEFDSIMNSFKQRYGVARKLEFTPEQMRDLAAAYRTAARDHGVVFVDDPFEALMSCILKVVSSWDAADPTLYREYTNIAEEWGTAVICQRMVFGNLGPSSGAGVAFTANPLQPYSHHQVRLFGDFAVGTQGEDLVGGLVFPLPISENQRRGSPSYADDGDSLESLFPDIYDGLLTFARSVSTGPNADAQEIEFTFESPARKDLYLLQQRPVVPESRRTALRYVDATAPESRRPLAFAMGVSGGAYIGRVAITATDVARLKAEHPDGPIILVRPDTVPEDLELITQVDGLLTARGGVTSHAAVTAKRLGKTAAVGCHTLTVREQEGCLELAGQEVSVGDWLTIDGRSGNIFLGRAPLVDWASWHWRD